MDINKILKDDDASSINEEQLGSLTKAAADLVAKQREIDACAAKLKELNAEARKISEKDIPELMDNLGVDKITLKDGHVITVADSVQCSIPATVRPGAYSWLEDNGHGDLIKTALTAKFGRGEKEEAQRALDTLLDLGISGSISESVHASTLKAWAREELAKGRALPETYFKVHVARITKIK